MAPIRPFMSSGAGGVAWVLAAPATTSDIGAAHAHRFLHWHPTDTAPSSDATSRQGWNLRPPKLRQLARGEKVTTSTGRSESAAEQEEALAKRPETESSPPLPSPETDSAAAKRQRTAR